MEWPNQSLVLLSQDSAPAGQLSFPPGLPQKLEGLKAEEAVVPKADAQLSELTSRSSARPCWGEQLS